MRHALTIAGSDSGGGAGLQADLKTFAAHGVFGTSVVTAITAQNTRQVTAALPIPPDIVVAQIDAVLDDIPIHAAKTGMLATGAIVRAVADAIARRAIPHLVVDPVRVAKSGDRLLDPDAVSAVIDALVPQAFVVTPNVPEAEVLAGIAIGSTAAAREAARRIQVRGARAVLVKGGHLEGPESVDVLVDGTAVHELRAPRLPARMTHGTGCTLSAAIAANLALGSPLLEAVIRAKRYLTEAIRQGVAVGSGHGVPHHLWPLRPAGNDGAAPPDA